MFVCCECYLLSGRGLCDKLITHPEESYRLWCVVVCDQETSRMRRLWPALGRSATENKNKTVKNLIIQTIWHWGYLNPRLIRFLLGDAKEPIGKNQRVLRVYFRQDKILPTAGPVFNITYNSFRYFLNPLLSVSFVRKCSTDRIREAPVITKNGNILVSRYISRPYIFIQNVSNWQSVTKCVSILL